MAGADDLLTRWPALDVAGRRTRLAGTFHFTSPAPSAVQRAAERVLDGLWSRDPALWSDDSAVQRSVANRLGWLSSPDLMAESLDRLHSFAESVKTAGFTDVV